MAREGMGLVEYLAETRVDTPCWVVDLGQLRANLELLEFVRRRTESKILLALKGFAAWRTFPLVRRYLDGVAASSPDEARLGREEFGREVHAYAPAYSLGDLQEIVRHADHLVFNSLGQYRHFRELVRERAPGVECGLRINPEHSEVKVALYDPCARYSRLGVTRSELGDVELAGLDGLHFHTLCEKDADALERTLAVVEEKFGSWLDRVRWVNFGGGHHITRPGYDLERLVRVVREFRARHRVEVYLEPGEAVALDAGVLVASVLDIVTNELPIAILDTSAAAHMPDVLEMPYRPPLVGARQPGEYPYTYRLTGLTCLAGDVIGDYSFLRELRVGDQVVFGDMAHYSMVKATTFNGVRLPSIATFDPETGSLVLVRRFGYQDFRSRLS
jgi:carboxynorspermidine decarboxylase